MADRFDELMKGIAAEADAKVDYAAMHDAILQKAAAEKRRARARAVRYGAMAATLVILVGAGSIFLRTGGRNFIGADKASDTPMAVPGAAPNPTALDAVDVEQTLQDTEATIEVCPTQPYTVDGEGTAGRGATPQDALPPPAAGEPQETNGDNALEATGEATSASLNFGTMLDVFLSEVEGYAHVFTVEELAALCQDARGSGNAMGGFKWLYAPISAPDGYRLMDIAAGERGVAYRYSKAAGAAYNDGYALYIFADCLSGQQAPMDEDGVYAPKAEDIAATEAGLVWAVGDGTACIIPGDGLSLFLEELRPYCALRLVGLEECGTRK